MTSFLHLVTDLCLELEQIGFHSVEEVTFALRALPFFLPLLWSLSFLLDADWVALIVHLVKASVYIFVIQKVCKGHHKRDAWPIWGKGSICCYYVNIFKFVHSDIFLLVEIRILAQNCIQLFPLRKELVLALLSILDQSLVLQELEVLVVPVHEDIWLFGPTFEHMVVNWLLAESHLIEDVGV